MLCPHCKQSLATRKVEGRDTIIEYCKTCKAAWFEKGELATLLGRDPETAVEVPENPIRLDNTPCPVCKTPLFMFAYPDTGRVIEGCDSCGGIWVDREDLAEIRALPAPEPPKAPRVSTPAKAESAGGGANRKPAPERKVQTLETPKVAPPKPAVVRERLRYSERFGLTFSRLLLQSSTLRIDQEIPDWAETKLHLVVANSYRVRSLRGSTVGWVEEQGEGLRALIRRSIQRQSRAFVLEVLGSARRETILEIRRDEGTLEVNWQGTLLGSVTREGEGAPNGWNLLDGGGTRFSQVRFTGRPSGDAQTPGDWEFPVGDRTGAGATLITKKWAGTWKETTTDSDNFRIDFGTAPWSPEQRAVIFAAVFAIDFDLFEDDNPEDGPE